MPSRVRRRFGFDSRWEGLDSAAAFVFEPVVGATLGAAVPPEGYVARIAEICRERGILLIADEVMTGMGRTGKSFAVQHWSVEPDIILTGKGIASGYAPLGAVLVAPNIVEAFENGTGTFKHGFTYQAHPVATAAGNAVLDYIESHDLFERVAPAAGHCVPPSPLFGPIVMSAISAVLALSSASNLFAISQRARHSILLRPLLKKSAWPRWKKEF